MEEQAIKILDDQRIMAIATVRPDGWPQNTIVGYANVGLDIYFLVSRRSQKFTNIKHDARVALAIGGQPADIYDSKAVFAGAEASEVIDQEQRKHAWHLLTQRHPNLLEYQLPGTSEAALMRAVCRYVSILDFTRGLGHTDNFTVGVGDASGTDPGRIDDWGLTKRTKKDGRANKR